jgi:lipopolysaccharide/colanic/teichoic acid biosynthesis glycosyltransferase
LSAKLHFPTGSENSSFDGTVPLHADKISDVYADMPSLRKTDLAARFSLSLVPERPSSWELCGLKRLFDFTCVLIALPLLLPIFLVVGLAIRFTSRGPVLFLRKRTGRHSRTFTILKFRTMTHSDGSARNAVTTTENQRFTPVGPFLRRWKLDELPQLLNVLVGDMSLVGPRPKLPEHQIADLRCRPGITGAATIAFAREEQVLACLPGHHLEDYYLRIILPAKHRLDTEYMARATFSSDLKLIIDTILRRWDGAAMHRLLNTEAVEADSKVHKFKVPVSTVVSTRVANLTNDSSLVSAD